MPSEAHRLVTPICSQILQIVFIVATEVLVAVLVRLIAKAHAININVIYVAYIVGLVILGAILFEDLLLGRDLAQVHSIATPTVRFGLIGLICVTRLTQVALTHEEAD